MTSSPIAAANFTPANHTDAARGLLGYLTITLDAGVVIDGVALRRTLDDRVVLSWPAHRAGRRRACVRPVDDDARRRLEAEVLALLGTEAQP